MVTTTTPTPAETVKLAASLEMNSLEFIPEYNNPNSTQFQTLATEVCDEVCDLISKKKQLHKH